MQLQTGDTLTGKFHLEVLKPFKEKMIWSAEFLMVSVFIKDYRRNYKNKVESVQLGHLLKL